MKGRSALYVVTMKRSQIPGKGFQIKEMEKSFPGTDSPGHGADKPSPARDETESSIVLAPWDCRLEAGNGT